MVRLFTGRFSRYKYSILFVSIIAIILLWPLVQVGYPFLIPAFFFLIMVGVLGALEIQRKYFFPTLVVGLVGLIAHMLELGIDPGEKNYTVYIVVDVAYIIFFSIAIFFMLRHVFMEKQVTWDTIQGGISIYFLMGLLWSVFYGLLLMYDPDAIAFPASVDKFSSALTYFSFTTLTTLGYGDITPRSDFAKNLTIIQSTLGPLYLAVLVSRLVGLHVADSRRRSESD